MSKTSCCNLKYIGENHNPVHIAKYCRNCGHIHEFKDDMERYREALEKIANYKTEETEYIVQSFMKVLEIADNALSEVSDNVCNI